MPKKAPVLTCTEEDRATLDRWIISRTIEARLVERAKIIMKCIQRQSVLRIAKDLKIDEKPSIQALERATGYVETDSGKIVRGERGK